MQSAERSLSLILERLTRALPEALAEPVRYAAGAGGITDTNAVEAIPSPGSGRRIYIGSVQAVNADGTTVTEVTLEASPSGTVLHRFHLGTSGGGYAATFSPLIRVPEGEALQVHALSAAQVYVNVQGWIA